MSLDEANVIVLELSLFIPSFKSYSRKPLGSLRPLTSSCREASATDVTDTCSGRCSYGCWLLVSFCAADCCWCHYVVPCCVCRAGAAGPAPTRRTSRTSCRCSRQTWPCWSRRRPSWTNTDRWVGSSHLVSTLTGIFRNKPFVKVIATICLLRTATSWSYQQRICKPDAFR